MRRILIFAAVCCLSFLLSVCSAPEAHNANGNGYEDNKQGGDETADNGGSEENQGGEQSDDSAETFVSFKNISSYPVSVYCGDIPRRNSSVFAEVSPGSSAKVKYNGLTDITQTFYFVYNFDFNVKDVSFPYFSSDSDDNHKSLKVQKGSVTNVIIDEITKCSTKSAFLLLDNQTTSDIYILLVDAPITPFGQQDKFIRSGGCAVYEIGDDGSFLLESAYRAKICIDAENTDLPEIDYLPGYIYTVSVTSAGAVLKAVTPFDIDTKKQMWNFDDDTFAVSIDEYPVLRPVMRKAANSEEGCLLLGALHSDESVVALMSVDVKSNKKMIGSAKFSNPDCGTLIKSSVLDFLQQSDGSIVFLLENLSKGDDNVYYIYEMLLCYDFVKRNLMWELTFQAEYSGYMSSAIGTDEFYIDFYSDSTNTMYRMEDNKIAVVGAVSTADTMYPFFTVVDASDYAGHISDKFTISSFISFDLKAQNEAESFFTSVYYDGADFYVAGYANCDFNYTDLTYKGVVYKFNGDLTSFEQLYEKTACLFLCIDGKGTNWYVCGEYCDAGSILKGCYISSDMILSSQDISLHTSIYPYCWFDQLLCYDGKIILYGVTSCDKAGDESPLPFIASYTESGTLLWENTSLTRYKQAYSLIPNNIGTYVLQLTNGKNNMLHYISADLLGCE